MLSLTVIIYFLIITLITILAIVFIPFAYIKADKITDKWCFIGIMLFIGISYGIAVYKMWTVC